jgi:phospholipid transport system substrate-binding protein
MHRRFLIRSTAALALAIMFAPAPARAQPNPAQHDPAEARAFVQKAGSEMAGLLNAPGSPAEKRARLQAFVDRVADVNSVAQFCLGRYWRIATPAQQQEYIALFHSVLVKSVSGRAREEAGETAKVTVFQAEQREEGVRVATLVERPGSQPFRVTWVVGFETGGPKIIDVIAEGTSLRLTQRSDYVAFLSRNGNNVENLLTALRQQSRQD